MFTPKSSSWFAKLGDVSTILFLSTLFSVGGILLSRHVLFAVPFIILFVLLMLPMFALRWLNRKTSADTKLEDQLFHPAPVIEWKQIVGKDGELVEVGYIKKRRTDTG